MNKFRFPKKLRSAIAVSVAVGLVLSLAGSVSARRRIDNRVDVDAPIIPLESSGTPSSSSGNYAFEKGDAIYRKFEVPDVETVAPGIQLLLGLWSLNGHCGLYWYWEPDGKNDPTIKENHKTIESNLARQGSLWQRWRNKGVHTYDFQYFVDSGQCWGVRTSDKLIAEYRVKIIETAMKQLDCKYSLVGGYKRPGVSFRCDGLVEYCYEIALGDEWKPGKNGGIVKNDFFRPRRGCTVLTPRRQFNRLSAQDNAFFVRLIFAKREGMIFHKPIEIKGEEVLPDENGKYKVYGDEVRVNVNASDIDWEDDGSGITRVQLWVGEPDDTPLNMPGFRIIGEDDDKDYPDEHDYTYYWDTTKKKDGEPLFPDGNYTLKAIAFDQAGNKAEAEIQVEVANLEDKYLHVSVVPADVRSVGTGGNTEDDPPHYKTETFDITVEAWNYGECDPCTPEGCVRKKEGTQNWIYGQDEEGYWRWKKETVCESYTTEPVRDETWTGSVTLSPLKNAAGLFKEGWDGTITITAEDYGKKTIEGVTYKSDNDISPHPEGGNFHTALLIWGKASGVDDGNALLLINPVYVTVYVTVYDTARQIRAGTCYITDEKGTPDAAWAFALAEYISWGWHSFGISIINLTSVVCPTLEPSPYYYAQIAMHRCKATADLSSLNKADYSAAVLQVYAKAKVNYIWNDQGTGLVQDVWNDYADVWDEIWDNGQGKNPWLFNEYIPDPIVPWQPPVRTTPSGFTCYDMMFQPILHFRLKLTPV